MFLVKCNCGCIYTLKDDQLNYPIPEHDGGHRCCPACGTRHEFKDITKIENLFNDSGRKFKLYFLPDNRDVIVEAIRNL